MTKEKYEVSVSEAKEVLDNGGHIFLDCRDTEEFEMGHIPGALSVPSNLMGFRMGKKIPDKNTNVIVYGKSGQHGCQRTAVYNVRSHHHQPDLETCREPSCCAYMFFKCSLMVRTSTPNNTAMSFWDSQIILSSYQASTRRIYVSLYP